MKIYSIALFLFLFSTVVGGIDGMALFDANLPEIGIESEEARVSEVQDTVKSGWSALFFLPLMIYRLFGVLICAFTTAITVIPMFIKYGIPLEIIAMIQGPIWLVYAVGMIQWITGHPFKTNE